ncbi:MAG: hypothetical protein WCP26_11805, partial [Actinomycetes bacterium]
MAVPWITAAAPVGAGPVAAVGTLGSADPDSDEADEALPELDRAVGTLGSADPDSDEADEAL